MSRDDERTGTYRGSADALPVEQALLLEQVCDAFEAAWRTGGDRPDIAAAVEELPEAVRPAAMRELAALDVHYRIRAGERPVAADYPGLHPAWLAGLSVAFEPGSTKYACILRRFSRRRSSAS